MTNFALVILMMLNRSRAAILGRSFEIKHSADERVKQHCEQLVYTQRVGSHVKCYCTLLRVIMRDEWLVVMTCTS